jgi:hypothetical protein
MRLRSTEAGVAQDAGVVAVRRAEVSAVRRAEVV